ncbi:MAG: BLUF domain-containing protein [Betaproteobacteria bacterium]|nr:BLUF domain-containing protein [Betaproteobacteria bacterium]
MSGAPLYSLAYTSRAAPDMASRAARMVLHDDAKVRNTQSNLTGLLIYVEGLFVQVLEGPKVAVSALFQNIVHDVRHDEVRLICECEIDARAFADWSMALCEFDDESTEAQTQIHLAVDEARETGALTPLTALESIVLRMKRN